MTTINLALHAKILTDCSKERIQSLSIHREAENCETGLVPGVFSPFVALVQG